MSSCEFFKALTSAASGGGKLVIVRLIRGDNVASDVIVNGKAMLGIATSDEVLKLAERALLENRVLEAVINGYKVVAEPVEPRPTIVVVGSGLIARALVDVGNAVGYYMAVVGNGDVKKDEFPNAYLVTNDLRDLEKLVGEDSVVIIANEGGKPYDADALYIALKGGARFVGLLASQKRAAYMIAEMVRRGLALDYVLNRLHSPVGLDLGAKTAGEIALSILAEVMMFMRNSSGKPMREVKDPGKYLRDALEGRIQEQSCSWRPTEFKL
ncbi:XdhC family protein [Vulcanisaeta thermophila]|uniref:XdhC family protein n=1 Tax=Vulcanisaeta thermophila TaxID=867917 RepID=UPI000852C5AF|nr:XdhC family protein [Vulcanisaeta thermophila]